MTTPIPSIYAAAEPMGETVREVLKEIDDQRIGMTPPERRRCALPAPKPIVIVDTREKRPLSFSDSVEVRRGALAVADYSLAGFEDDVAIERKELGDLLNSITHERVRFIKELRQLRGYRLAVLLVESDWPTILEGAYRSQVSPSAVVGSIMAFTMRYNVMPILAHDHETAGAIAERLLRLYAEQVRKDYRALTQGVD